LLLLAVWWKRASEIVGQGVFFWAGSEIAVCRSTDLKFFSAGVVPKKKKKGKTACDYDVFWWSVRRKQHEKNSF
jgi:hypothetical protein